MTEDRRAGEERRSNWAQADYVRRKALAEWVERQREFTIEYYMIYAAFPTVQQICEAIGLK